MIEEWTLGIMILFFHIIPTDLTNSSQIENSQIVAVGPTPVLGLKDTDTPDRMDTATVQQCTVYPAVEELNLATDTDVKSNVWAATFFSLIITLTNMCSVLFFTF